MPVASKLASAIGASPDSLAARPEIAPLKTATVGAAGFFTLRAIPESALLFAGPFGGPSTREGFDELALLPHRGAVPDMVLVDGAVRGGHGAGRGDAGDPLAERWMTS